MCVFVCCVLCHACGARDGPQPHAPAVSCSRCDLDKTQDQRTQRRGVDAPGEAGNRRASGRAVGNQTYVPIEIMQYTDTRPLRPGEPGEQAEAYTQEKQALRRDSGPKGWIRGPDREKKKDRREPKRN